MGDDTAGERMDRFRERRRQEGKVEIRIWAPPELGPLLRAIAADVTPADVPALTRAVENLCAQRADPSASR